MRTRPRRPYKNFGLFCWANGADTGRPYPCLACRGQGSVEETDDLAWWLPDRRRSFTCTACGGTGKGTKEACRKAYREAIGAYRQEKAEYETLVLYRSEGRQKLNKNEIKAIQELGI